MLFQYQKRAVQLVSQMVLLTMASRRATTYERYLVAVMERQKGNIHDLSWIRRVHGSECVQEKSGDHTLL